MYNLDEITRSAFSVGMLFKGSSTIPRKSSRVIRFMSKTSMISLCSSGIARNINSSSHWGLSVYWEEQNEKKGDRLGIRTPKKSISWINSNIKRISKSNQILMMISANKKYIEERRKRIANNQYKWLPFF